MKSLQIQRFGEPADALKVVEITPPPLRDGEVRVRIKAAGINPSDVANAKGAFPSTTLPRIIGRDFAGEIVEGPLQMIGVEVWGSGGDLGFTRDGTHAEMIDLPREAVSEKPKSLSMEEAAVIGVPFTAAYKALEVTRQQPGEWVVVTGAAGAVGSAAIELVHARRGFVIALVKDSSEESMLPKDKVNALASSASGNLAEVVRQATNGKGADIALNGIGALVGAALMSSLAAGGRMAVYGAALGGREIQIDLFTFYRNLGADRREHKRSRRGESSGHSQPTETDFRQRLTRSASHRGTIFPRRFVAAYNRVNTAAGKVVFCLSAEH